MGEREQYGADVAGVAYGGIAADNILTNSKLYGDLVETSESLAQAVETESPALAAGARAVPIIAVGAPVAIGAMGTGIYTRKGWELAERGYESAGEHRQLVQNAAVRGVEGTGDTVAGYWDEDATVRGRAREHTGQAWGDIREHLSGSAEEAQADEESFDRWTTGGAAAGFGAGAGTSYLLAHNYPDLYQPIAEYTEPVAQAADAIAPEAGAAVRTVPFATVVLVGAAGSARAGKWMGAGSEEIYDAVRNPGDVDFDMDSISLDDYRERGGEFVATVGAAGKEGYDTVTTASVDGLQWTWDELQEGKEFVVTSAPYQKTVNSGPFNYFVRTPTGVAKRVGKSCASFGRDYINMKREHWGDKKQLWSDYISPPYGSGLRGVQDEDDEVE